MEEGAYVVDPYAVETGMHDPAVMQQHPHWQDITPDYVIQLHQPTDYFLCPNSANIYQVDFIGFKIHNHDTREVLFEVAKPPEDIGVWEEDGDDSARQIVYNFGPHFLEIGTVGTELAFNIGPYPMHRFRMIERHYFRDILIKSFDFEMPFCMPNSTNTWEVMYTMPEMDPALKEAISQNPWACKSDTFYFVEDRLVMHNKAEYNFSAFS
jgi:hypothetical protein